MLPESYCSHIWRGSFALLRRSYQTIRICVLKSNFQFSYTYDSQSSHFPSSSSPFYLFDKYAPWTLFRTSFARATCQIYTFLSDLVSCADHVAYLDRFLNLFYIIMVGSWWHSGAYLLPITFRKMVANLG